MIILFFLLMLIIYASFNLFAFKNSHYGLLIYFLISSVIFLFPLALDLFFEISHPSRVNNSNIEVTKIFVVYKFFYDLFFLIGYFCINNSFILNSNSFSQIKSKLLNVNFKIDQLITTRILFFVTLITLSSEIYSVLTLNFFHVNNANICLLSNIIPAKISNYFISHTKNYLNIFLSFRHFFKIYLIIVCYYIFFDHEFLKKNKKLFFYLIIIIFSFLSINLLKGSRLEFLYLLFIFYVIFIRPKLNIYIIMHFIIFIFLIIFTLQVIGTTRTYSHISDQKCVTLNMDKLQDNLKLRLNNLTSKNFESRSHNNHLNGFLEMFIGRLNYYEPVLKSIEYKLNSDISVSNFYYNNLYGLIPRFIFPEKKIITNNADVLGVEIKMHQHKRLFAVGIRSEGESYIIFGNFGLIVALILGLIIGAHHSLLYSSKQKFTSAVYLFLLIGIMMRDSYHALLPGLVKEYILILLLVIIIKYTKFLTLNNFKNLIKVIIP